MRTSQFQCTFIGTLSGRAACIGNEKVGLRLIRVRQPGKPLQAVLRSFFAADRILLAWACQSNGRLECEFEIVYDDGYRVEGNYLFIRKGETRPGLSRQVRAKARDFSQCTNAEIDSALSVGYAFLERYETDDASLH